MPKIQVLNKKYKKKVYPQYYLTIPLDVMESKEWHSGDEIEFKNYSGRIYLSKKD